MKTLTNIALALVGVVLVVALWAAASQTVAPDLPSPVKTWGFPLLLLIHLLVRHV